MNITQLIRYHPSITHAEDMRELCEPLKKLGISYFGHAHLNEKGELTCNSSNPAFLENYYKEGFYDFDLHQTDKNPRYVLWDLVARTGKSAELYQTGIEFGLYHTFTIMVNDNNVKNCYHFAAKPGDVFMNEFYIQHLDLLEKFVDYFKDHLLINDRLNKAYNMGCKRSSKDAGYLIKGGMPNELHESDVAAFLQSIGAKCTPKNAREAKTVLARREQQCAYFLLEGRTSQEIADRLHISPRTVEVYFERLKKRFGSRNRIHLARQLTEEKIRDRDT